MSSIQVTDITVKKYRIVCLVKIAGDCYSNDIIKNKVLTIMPSLKFHKCKNADDKAFKDILNTTSLAHILEHMIIDKQIQAHKDYVEDKSSNIELFGTTKWIDEKQGLAQVEVSFYDDVVALKAIKESQKILNNLINC